MLVFDVIIIYKIHVFDTMYEGSWIYTSTALKKIEGTIVFDLGGGGNDRIHKKKFVCEGPFHGLSKVSCFSIATIFILAR